MSKPITLNVVYAGGKTLQLSGTFTAIIARILTQEPFTNYSPLKLAVAGSAGVLYFDDHAFAQFQQGGITYDELLERTHCDELYRNTASLAIGPEYIDSGSLWMLKANELTLIDDDRHVTFPLNTHDFAIAR